jgi:hypothetical protein
LPRAPAIVRAAVAPAFGAAVLACITLVLVHLHVRVSGGGAVAAVSAAIVGSVLAGAVSRRTPLPEAASA